MRTSRDSNRVRCRGRAAAGQAAARRACVGLALVLGAACDDDPSGPELAFGIAPCETDAALGVNAPVTIAFTGAIAPGTVTGANVVVTDAETGVELPGALTVGPDGQSIVFTPSDAFPFDREIRFRVQNIRSADQTRILTAPAICTRRTVLPPITQLYWEALPSAGGRPLVGVSLPSAARGYTISQAITLYRRDAGDEFRPRVLPSRVQAGYDVDFLTADRGFIAAQDFRARLNLILETRDGGATYDSLAALDALGGGSRTIERIEFRSIGPALGDLFGATGGGNNNQASFGKYNRATQSASYVQEVFNTGRVHDLEFAADTLFGAAASEGVDIVAPETRGQIFISMNGGASWTALPGRTADANVQRYHGVAVRPIGDGRYELVVTGGSGYAMRLSQTAVGATTFADTALLVGALTNVDPEDEFALIYNDAAFAPDNSAVGWIVGAQQVGVVAGVPRYQGVIFATADGGRTWTRQGVRDAEEFGAAFPALNRIAVLSQNEVWIVGDGGYVIQYVGPPTQ
ncbi:MAG TPA: hypothetical protein VNA89_03525 [Gemmatimonadaceae bacterium]|nr:hypothetical protein [Gemmatimonadaceae bacterium]